MKLRSEILGKFELFESFILPFPVDLCLKSIQGDRKFLFLKTLLHYVSKSIPRVSSNRNVLIWHEIGAFCSPGIANFNMIKWRSGYKRCFEYQRFTE